MTKFENFLCASTLMLASSVSYAIPIISGDGTEVCSYGPALGAGDCTVQPISVSPVWQQNNPDGSGARWISYADTGPAGSTLAPVRGTSANPDGQTVIVTFTESFFATLGDTLNLNVWADDTAAVRIDGLLVFGPNFTQDIFCTDGPIGCEPKDKGIIAHIFQSPGIHRLSFDVYQYGNFVRYR